MYTLSIVLVTRNRPENLEKTLSSLRAQPVQPFEVIISDDSNEEEAVKANKCLAKKYGYIYLSGPQNGLYANRNFAALHIKGTHFRTMDDDHEFPEKHFETCMQAVEAEPGTIWTIGEYSESRFIHEAPHPVPGQLHPRGFSFFRFKKNEYYGISCGATIYPQSVIDNKILNCELYKFGMVFLEYGARLKQYGYIIRPLSGTYIIHHNNQTTAASLPLSELNEARIFSMLCLSFKYQKNWYNMAATVFQMLLDVVRKRTKPSTIWNAYKNYKLFTATV